MSDDECDPRISVHGVFKTFRLGERRQRARCYEVVLREGMPRDIVRYVDGALLVDLLSELVLPREIRDAWQPVIDEATG